MGNTTKVDFLEKEINYIFRDKSLIQDALTHPSANNCGLKSQYQAFTEADISLLKTKGYSEKFTSLEVGVKSYLDWLSNNT